MYTSWNTQYCQMAILPKLIYKSKAISIAILTDFLEEINQWILKFVWNYKEYGVAKTILKKNNNVEGLTLLISNFTI